MSKKYRPRIIRSAIAAAFLLFVALNLSLTGAGRKSTAKSLSAAADTAIQPVLSGNVPTEVYIPHPDPQPVNNRPAFDRFSWQTFIALCWPADPAHRGVPLNPNDAKTFLGMNDSTAVVWSSYKDQWDLFGQGANTPSPWNVWTDPNNICKTGQIVNHVFGTAKSAMGMLPGEGNESLSVPLVDQHKNYALFEMRYNKVQYNFVVNNGLYLNKNLLTYMKQHGDTLAMPISNSATQGAIMVKAAWKVLTAADDPGRYYILDGLVFDPVSNTCHQQRMGLVGLHIAQKVDQFSEWVWSSFEQVDNVPGAPNAKAPYSFNNGTQHPGTGQHGYADKPRSSALIADQQKRVPVQVNRLNAIPVTPAGAGTVDINKLYQAAVGKTWLRYYQLVITQWPANAGQFKQSVNNGIYPQDCGAAFPANNCVNTTLETYFQSPGDAVGAGGNACMSCHYRSITDFSWSLQLRAH